MEFPRSDETQLSACRQVSTVVDFTGNTTKMKNSSQEIKKIQGENAISFV